MTEQTPWNETPAFGKVIIVGMAIGLLWVAMSCFCGCAGVDPSAIGDAIERELPAEKPAQRYADSLDLSTVKWMNGADVSGWAVTHELSMVKPVAFGGRLYHKTTAQTAWPVKDDVVGTCWFIVKRDGQWRAYNWDYLRANSQNREVPWYPPKDGADYQTIREGEEWHFLISGLARDHRRNVSERTNSVRAQ